MSQRRGLYPSMRRYQPRMTRRYLRDDDLFISPDRGLPCVKSKVRGLLLRVLVAKVCRFTCMWVTGAAYPISDLLTTGGWVLPQIQH